MTSRRQDSTIEFVPIQPSDFPRLWQWRHLPHVWPWFESWSPPTYEESAAQWLAMVEGRAPERGYLIVVGGREVGYIESYDVDDDPEFARALALGHRAVAADLYIGDPEWVNRGLGPRIVGLFYLMLMDQTGLDVGIIDPTITNKRAIRAYEKAGFSFLKDVDTGDATGLSHIMRASREELEAALRQPPLTPS